MSWRSCHPLQQRGTHLRCVVEMIVHGIQLARSVVQDLFRHFARHSESREVRAHRSTQIVRRESCNAKTRNMVATSVRQ